MGIFGMYFKLGVEHITDFSGYDHIVFLIALCAAYTLKEWKNVLILITAFTLGHTLTLALATLQWVKVPQEIIEFLIPLTIFITAVGNFRDLKKGELKKRNFTFKYALALIFGLIHGMGFSNYLRELLGQSTSLLKPLLAFNLGVEAGQLIIVSCIFILSSLFFVIKGIKKIHWTSGLSFSSGLIALYLMIERWGDMM